MTNVALEILAKTRVECPGCKAEQKLEDVVVAFRDRSGLSIVDCLCDCSTAWRRVDVAR